LGIVCFAAAGISLGRNKTKAQRAAKLNKVGVAFYSRNQYDRAIRKF